MLNLEALPGHHVHMVELAKDAALPLMESDADLYFVKRGYLRIDFMARDGKEITLEYLRAGDVFGGLTLAPHLHCQTTATALCDAVIYRPTREGLELLIAKHASVAAEVNRLIGRRVLKLQRRLQQVMQPDLRVRLMHALGDLAAEFGEPTPTGTRIGLRLTHEDLAHLIGATRAATSTAVSQLRAAGLLEIERKHPVLLKKDAG